VLLDNWRPNGKVGSNQIGFWGAISFSSVSIKDRSLLVPLVMLSVCLIFSWPNKVPFDHESSSIIQARIYTSVRIGATGSMMGTRRVSPSYVLAIGQSLSTAALVCPATFT
jgi:hypothetical protein